MYLKIYITNIDEDRMFFVFASAFCCANFFDLRVTDRIMFSFALPSLISRNCNRAPGTTLYTETFENQMEHYAEDNEGWEKYEKHFQLFMMIPHGITKLHPKVDWW